MSLFKKKSLAEDLAQAEEKYNEAVEAIEAVEEAAVEEELSLDAELEKIESETDAEVAADTEAVVEKSARRKGLEFTYELGPDGLVHQTQIDIDVRTPDLLEEDFGWVDGMFNDFLL